MGKNAYDLKSALPNKLLNEDGNITDLLGNPVNVTSLAYKNKRALPNKWLNPDGSYSTLKDIIGGAIDTDLFVIVEELPDSGDPGKIYLAPDGEGGFIEYHYDEENEEWSELGTVQLDLSNYWNIQEVQQAIATALQTSKNYTDMAIQTSITQVLGGEY